MLNYFLLGPVRKKCITYKPTIIEHLNANICGAFAELQTHRLEKVL